MQSDILSLPWHIQVALSAGYLGYVVAYMGSRSDHKTHDVVFRTLVFSLIASSAYQLAITYSFGILLAAAFAVFVALASGVIWRKWVGHWTIKAVRGLDISHSDDTASALSTLRTNSKVELTGVSVLLTDGTWLCADDTSLFSDCDYPAFTLGESGDVVMYIGSSTGPDGTATEMKSTLDTAFGDRLTYIPRDRITRINMRYRKTKR